MSRKNVIFRIFGMATCFLFIIGLMFEPSADWNFKRQEVGSSYFQQDSANASWSPANVTEYHSELHYCTRTTKYKLTESELKTRRKEVTEAVTFPEMKWMSNYKNPCQNIRYPLLDTKEFWNIRSQCRKDELAQSMTPISCLPYVYLAGVHKSGTSDLYYNLLDHPHIFSGIKEPEYMSLRATGLRSGSGVFSWRNYIQLHDEPSKCLQAITTNGTDYHPAIALDDSPGLLWYISRWFFYPGNGDVMEPKVTVADLIHKVTPQAHFLFIFRNPTDRLYSHFYHRCRTLRNVSLCTKYEFHNRVVRIVKQFNQCRRERSLRECAYDSCITKMDRNSVISLQAGLYHVYLKDWLKVFPIEQMFIINHDSYSINRIKVLSQVTDFLGLDPFSAAVTEAIMVKDKKKVRKSWYEGTGEMLAETKTLLDQFYAPFNKALSDLLKDETFMWDTNY